MERFIASGEKPLTRRASGTTASDHFSMQASTNHAKNTQRAILHQMLCRDSIARVMSLHVFSAFHACRHPVGRLLAAFVIGSVPKQSSSW